MFAEKDIRFLRNLVSGVIVLLFGIACIGWPLVYFLTSGP